MRRRGALCVYVVCVCARGRLYANPPAPQRKDVLGKALFNHRHSMPSRTGMALRPFLTARRPPSKEDAEKRTASRPFRLGMMRFQPARPDTPVHTGREREIGAMEGPTERKPRAHTARADDVPTPGAKRGAKSFKTKRWWHPAESDNFDFCVKYGVIRVIVFRKSKFEKNKK